MKLTANYLELTDILHKKTEENICIEFGGNDKDAIVRYLGFLCQVHIEKVESQSVSVSYQIINETMTSVDESQCSPKYPRIKKLVNAVSQVVNCATQALENKAAKVVVGKLIKQQPAIFENPDKSITIYFDKIPQLNGVINNVILSDLYFDKEGLIAEVSLKKAE